jgi:BON domain-containing protein
MRSNQLPHEKSFADSQLERRIALALLTVRALKFRFLHVHAGEQGAMRLASSGTQSVRLEAHNGAVTLVGEVPSAGHKQTLDSLVRRVPGVVRVIDRVEVNADRWNRFVPQFG